MAWKLKFFVSNLGNFPCIFKPLPAWLVVGHQDTNEDEAMNDRKLRNVNWRNEGFGMEDDVVFQFKGDSNWVVSFFLNPYLGEMIPFD